MKLSFLKKSKKDKVRTRIAPSPTGPLHIGTARSALYNYLFAMQKDGEFILRIEDTDAERSDTRFEKNIIEGLEWLGLKYDKFYRQSERKEIYQKYIKKLLKKGDAFWCGHTIDELKQEKKEQTENREPPRHICEHKTQNAKRKTQKREVIRLKESSKKIQFNDMIRGKIEFDGALLGDFAIAKDEKTPLYNLAVVIDDYEMDISHVIRGEDHIPNTPKQILIQEALKLPQPYYAHLPLILGADRSKLSKRYGATSISDYKHQGYLAEAMINFMALLGWNPGDNKEIIEKKKLIKQFSIDKIQKSGAIFNIDKLNWFNSAYIKKMTEKELSETLIEYVPEKWQEKIKKNPEFWKKIIKLEKTRLVKLSSIKEGVDFFFEKPSFARSLLAWKDDTPDNTFEYLDTVIKLLSDLSPSNFNIDSVKNKVWDFAEEKGRGNVLWPFRVALTGLAKSPDPFSVAEILGQKETIERLKYGKEIIYGNPKYNK